LAFSDGMFCRVGFPDISMKVKKEILLVAISLTLSLAVIEIGLRIFTNFPIHGPKSNRVAHSVLGFTLDPSKISDVDASGFRNPGDKGRHEIVAIGDSHTYGSNVEWNESWPYQLGRILNKSVYNYGIGGYGIYHYLHLAKEAAKHKPEYVILGFFSGNDISPSACYRISPSYFQELVEREIIDEECLHESKKTKPNVNAKTKLSEKSAVISALKYLRKIYIKPLKAHFISSEKYFNLA